MTDDAPGLGGKNAPEQRSGNEPMISLKQNCAVRIYVRVPGPGLGQDHYVYRSGHTATIMNDGEGLKLVFMTPIKLPKKEYFEFQLEPDQSIIDAGIVLEPHQKTFRISLSRLDSSNSHFVNVRLLHLWKIPARYGVRIPARRLQFDVEEAAIDFTEDSHDGR